MMVSADQLWLEQIGSAFETLNEGVVLNDSARRIVFANSVFLEMIQMPLPDLLGRSADELFPPEDVPRLLAYVERSEAVGRARYEFYIPQARGGHLPVAVTTRQLSSPDGTPFAVVTLTDISEQKRVEADLREANSKLEERQHQVEEELRLAERVQQSLAPKSLRWGGVSVETYYHPAWSIGGDYGLVTPREEYLDLLVCDVSGHGISSALVANRIYSETMIQIESGAGLAHMFRHLNHFMVQTLGSSTLFLTMAAARLDKTRRSLQFAGAGHPPAMLIRPGEKPALLESRSMVLGLFENAVCPDAIIETPVKAGDRIMIYTDGLSESFNSRHEMLGIEGLSEIAHGASREPLPQMKQQILDRVAAWRNGPAADDVSLVLVEIA